MKHLTISVTLLLFIMLSGCHEEWLDIKRNKEQVVPETLADLQALLDNSTVMNTNYFYLGEVGTTDLNITHEWWLRATLVNQNAYLWKADVFEGEKVLDWEFGYERIFYANTVLDILQDHPESEEKNTLRGSALFLRAFNYYKLAQTFCKPYDPASAGTDLGIPLRSEANINIPVTRASVQQTYAQILSDLDIAIALLPETSTYPTRPSLAAAHGLYAKTLLHMGDYQNALSHVNKTLALQNELIDYNTLDPEAQYPLQDGSEVIFYAQIASVFPIADYPYYVISEERFNSYEEGDLRKTIYFRAEDGTGGFNGSYAGRFFFGGLATNEMYLIRAECQARLDDTEKALEDLNILLQNRYAPQSFTPAKADTPEEALRLVIEERKKELIFRGLHWEDLRRLNKDERFAKTLTRTLDGQSYELPPNDPRYVMPIPAQVIQISGVPQNDRE